jgi:hypothetical protein
MGESRYAKKSEVENHPLNNFRDEGEMVNLVLHITLK